MGKDKIDRTVKDKLYDLHTPIDTNDLWNGIQSKMEAEKDPPAIAFSYRKFLGLGMLAFLLFGSFYFMQDNFSQESNNNSISNEIGLNSTEIDASANKNSITDEEIKSNNKNNNKQTLFSSKNESKSKESFSIKSNDENEASKQKLNSLANIKKSNTTKERVSKASSISSNNNITNRKRTNISNDQFTILSVNNVLDNTEEGHSSDKSAASRTNENNNLDTQLPSNAKIINKNKQENNFIEASKSESEKQEQTFELIPESNKLISILDLDSYAGLSLDPNFKDICESLKGDACTRLPMSLRNRVDCYDNWTADRSRLSILPYVGLDFVTNDGASSDTMSTYQIERENTMQFLEVLKIGALVKYNVTHHFYVKAGVEYDQIREKFEKTIVSTDVQFDPEMLIAYSINIEGDTIPVYGPGERTVIRTTQWRKYNKYHSFNVPVILGYEAPLSKRWDYFGEAGIFYNVKFSYEGKLLNADNEVVSGENFFANQTGVSLYGGAGVRFNAKKRWSAFAAGSYKYNLQPINNLEYNPVVQNLGLAGFSVGLEIRI